MNTNDDRMDCETFRERVAAEPAATDDALEAHATACADCRQKLENWRALDARIAGALAVPVPELRMPHVDAVHGDNVVALERNPRPRFSRPAWFGLAAGLALAAFFGVQFTKLENSSLPLAAQVIAHMDHEQHSRVVTDVAVPERTLEAVVGNDLDELNPRIGLVTYARSCVINGKLVPHLVIQGSRGPVTLLLMSEESVEGPVPLEGRGINGVILPVGDGSIAIVGERDEPLDQIREQVVNSVKWKT